MKVHIAIGDVVLNVTGLDLDARQIRKMLMDTASIAAAMNEQAPTPEPEPPMPMGFTAHIERLSEEILTEDLSEYFDE